MRWLFIGLSLFACSASLDAACRRRVVVQEVVAAVAAVPIATFVPLVVPAYSISYAPPAAPVSNPVTATPNTAQDEVTALRAELQQLRQQLAVVPRAEAIQEKPAAYLAILQAKCAACHDSKSPVPTSSKWFAFLDAGKLLPIPPAKACRLAPTIYLGRMPPPKNKKEIKPLTDEEVSILMAWIDGLK